MNIQKPIRFYISPEGNDKWSGLSAMPGINGSDGPFATLTRARDAIRQLKYSEADLPLPVEVQVRGGVYRMESPLQLSAGDSGTADCPVTWMAYPGETPVLSGGRAITGWQPYKDNILCTHLPQVRSGQWWFRQLFQNDRRMVRARWPKLDQADPLYGGWAFIESLLPDNEDSRYFDKHELPLAWRFKTDPESRGEAEQWFAPEADDSTWPELRTDEGWIAQGYKGYHGTAWYRLTLTVPAEFDSRRFFQLVFGAADKEAWVYIDGKKVGEHTVQSTGRNIEEIWNEPFAIDVRPYLQPGRQHTIAVRVDSFSHDGGLCRPVALVSAEKELDLGALSGAVPHPTLFRYEENVFPHHWAKPEQAEIFVIPGRSWISDIIPIREIDAEKRTIKLTRPVGPSANTLGNATHISRGNRFYVENNLEDLTEPGEWCLDGESGTLYFWPPEELLEGVEVIAPVAERLIEMIGTPSNALQYVIFRGFTLRHTQVGWPTPESYYKTPNAAQALYMENTAHCSIEDNFFDAVGGDAIRLQAANHANRITGNTISEAGAYGIFVANLQRGFARHDLIAGDVPSPSEWFAYPESRAATVMAWPRSSNHVISNNHIHHVGKYEKHGQGIAFYGVSAVEVEVSHNLIHNVPRFGIGLMSGFGRVTIEHNDLYNLSQETCDTGGICFNRWYTYEGDDDLRRGCIVRFNRVRDVIGCGAYGRKMEAGGRTKAGGRIWAPYYSWAIYFDNAPMDVLVHGNICARNTLGGIMISHYGRNVTVENNIFVDSDKSQAYMLFDGEMSNIRIRRNIFCYSNPDADFLRLNLGQGVDVQQVFSEFDGNVLFNTSGREPTLDGLPGEAVQRIQIDMQQAPTMDDWRKMGFDANSVVADPCFIDAVNDDYDLKPESPALKLGFVPIDVSGIGLLKQ